MVDAGAKSGTEDIARKTLGKQRSVTYDDICKELSNDVLTEFDKATEEEHFAGSYMKLMARDASVSDKSIGIRLLSGPLPRAKSAAVARKRAAARLASRVHAASAEDLRSAIAGLDGEEKTRLRTALNAHCTRSRQAL